MSYILFANIDVVKHKMNCTTCGNQTTSDQKFCRKCGATLETGLIDTAPQPGISRAGRMRLFGLISMFGGLGVAVTGSMVLHVDLVVYIGMLMNFLGMFLIVFPSVVPLSHAKPIRIVSTQPESDYMSEAAVTSSFHISRGCLRTTFSDWGRVTSNTEVMPPE